MSLSIFGLGMCPQSLHNPGSKGLVIAPDIGLHQLILDQNHIPTMHFLYTASV